MGDLLIIRFSVIETIGAIVGAVLSSDETEPTLENLVDSQGFIEGISKIPLLSKCLVTNI